MTTLTLHQQAVQRIRDLLASNEGATWTRTADLLADIMHFCNDDEETFEYELERAHDYFFDELKIDNDTTEKLMNTDPEDQYAIEDEFDDEPPRSN
jgi:hypothetical protein